MSLQIWLPLINSTQSHTINNIGLASAITTTESSTSSSLTSSPSGILGPAYKFDDGSGRGAGLTLNSNLLSILGSYFSISVWVCPHGSHIHHNGSIISSGDWNNTCWNFGVSQDNSKVDVFSDWYGKYLPCNIPLNTWTHLVCTNSNGTCSVYKNGSLVGSISAAVPSRSSASIATVGRETYANGYFGFNGSIQDLRIYDSVLSEIEIKNLSQGLILHYPLNQDTSTGHSIEYDVSGYKYNGALYGSYMALDSDTARYTSAYNFYNNNTYIVTPELPFSTFLSQYTFSWMSRSASLSGVMPWGFGDGNRLNLYATPHFCWNTGDGDSNPFINSTTGATVPSEPYKGAWHMYTVTGDGYYNILYIDGEYKGTATTYRGVTGTKIYMPGWDSSTDYKMVGSLSDFRIYSRALSASDVKKLYSVGIKFNKDGNVYVRGEFLES